MTLFALVRSRKRQHAGQAAGFAAVAIATAAFIGWWVSLPLLSSWGSGFATVKPVVALCLVALGLALMHPGKNSRLAFAVGLAVAAIAALDLLDRFGIDLGINRLNRLLVPRAAVPGSETSFRMINGVPLALALVGGSLTLSRFERYHFAAAALGALAGTTQVFALLVYLSGTHTFYAAIKTPTPLTAVGVLCVAGAIVLRVGTMPALRKSRPLWQLQVMLGFAIIAPLLMFGVYTGIRITDAQLHDVRENLAIEARSLSAGVDRVIIGEIERLQALAASPSLRQGDFAEFQRQAEASLALLQIGNIVLIDRNMLQLVNTFVPFGKPLPKAVVPSTPEMTFATGKPQVTVLFMAPFVDQFMFGITVPVEIDGESRYVLGRSQDQHGLGRRAVRAGGCIHREGAATGAVASRRTRGRIRIHRLRRATVAGGICEVGIDRLANRRVGAQGSARGSGSGAVADHCFDGIAGVYVGGCFGLVAGPGYRELGQPCGSRRNRFGRGRTDAVERNPRC